MGKVWAGVVVAAMLLGCGAGQVEGSDATADDGDALSNGVVKVIDQGNWSELLACSGQCEQRFHFWADLSVRNDAYQKDVGALWSKDGWATSQTAHASYVADLGGGFEKWHVEAVIGEGTSQPAEVEFAAFATMNGTTSWDGNNNYYVYQSVSADAPVRMLHAGLSYTSRGGVTLSGAARVFDLAYQKVVSVRYSTDGWATSHEVGATWTSANDWSFKAAGIAKGKPLPSAVEFAVRYQVGGQEFWDNNHGQNYRLLLEPAFQPNTGWVPSLENLSGIITLGSTWQTNLPVSGYSARLDTGSWKTGPNFTFSTLGLSDGAHQVSFKISIQGGYTATASIAFTVKNRITPLEAWQPTYADAKPGSIAPWTLAAGSDGKVYVNWSDGKAARYDAWGTTSAPLIYDAAASGIQGIAVDDQGRLVGFGTYPSFSLFRFGTDGHLDASFGTNGATDLTGPFDGSSICWVSAVAALGGHVQVADSCNERILDFDGSGHFLAATPVGSATAVVGLGVANGALYAASQDGLTKLELGRGGLQVTGTVSVPGLNGPAGVASAGGHLWVVDNISRLTALESDGSIDSSWQGGTGSFGLKGELPLARGVAALADGSIAVVATDDGALVRFSSVLR